MYASEQAPPRELAACRALLRDGSRSFHAASLLLPRHLSDAATALYGFCRVADDAIDASAEPEHALLELERRLARIYAGVPQDDPTDHAFAWVVARYGIPREVPAALLEGFAWDAHCRRYSDIAGLEAYAARVAGTVGVMMAIVMGAREPRLLARASDLGVAMQLTNIARDVGDDARAGRLYLPLSWLAEAGIEVDAWMAAPASCAGIAAVVERLLTHADRLYERAEDGINGLPASVRSAMYAARYLYAEIGHEVRRRRCRTVEMRATVSARRKLACVVRACAAATNSRSTDARPPLPAAAFLVDAVQPLPAAEARELAAEFPAWWQLHARLEHLLVLFERLERRQRGLLETTVFEASGTVAGPGPRLS